jgi:malonyl-CoA decarboxylase
LDDKRKAAYFEFLAREFSPDPAALAEASRAYLDSPDNETLKKLTRAVESQRLEFLRRLNLAPGATAAIVRMRMDLLGQMKGNPSLAAVDRDFVSQLNSWFNRGFLVLQRIDWSTPANILEKIISSGTQGLRFKFSSPEMLMRWPSGAPTAADRAVLSVVAKSPV